MNPRSLPTMTAAVAVILAVQAPGLAAPRTTPGRFARGGLDGTGVAVMQPVNVGARVARVAVVPGGDGRAWAIGRSTAKVPGWAGSAGQTVFLAYEPAAGWRITGPPVDAAGRVVNPTLVALAFAPGGEGWAVGDGGTLVRLGAGEATWRAVPPVATDVALHGVSLGRDASGVFGYAAGDAGSILRLDAGRWTREATSGTLGSADYLGVAAAGREAAWVVGESRGGIGDRSLVVARRTGGSWQQVTTGRQLFDGPHPVADQNVVFAASYGTAVAATPRGAWVAGTIIPLETSAAPDPVGDSSRPFLLWFDAAGGTTRSFCPDRYVVGSDGRAGVTAVCDEPFPLAAFDLTSLVAFDGPGRGEAFAAGLGLFHYAGGEWVREPDAVGYIASLSLASPHEGWAGITGDAIGAGASAPGSSFTLGHWTRRPERPRLARWSQPNTDPLEAVAVAPDGSGRAVAVGLGGATVDYRPLVGWETSVHVTQLNLHAVAWPSAERAWAVGQSGTIVSFDGSAWRNHIPAGRASLFGVAFSSPSRGYAVGSGGEILVLDGDRWRRDKASGRLTDETLHAIAAEGNTFVAVGEAGTVLENDGSGWRRRNVRALVERAGRLPALYAVAAAGDGTVLAGGEDSTLIRRSPAGDWTVDRQGARVPPEGTIIALGAYSHAGSTRVLASVSDTDLKYHGDQLGAADGWLLEGDARGWHDPELATRKTLYPGYDASAPRDPIYGIAMEPGRPAAWAVGGMPPDLDDGQGHRQRVGSSSAFRYEAVGDPTQPAAATTPELPASGVSFAFFGESSCGGALCGATAGSGPKADVVALQIRDEINRMSRLPGGPRFAIFGGNMRRSGVPEELGQFKRYLAGFRIPVFAALGNLDLFAGLQAPSSGDDVQPSNAFYLNAFADRPAPWGHAARRDGFLPVRTPACGAPRAGEAATHYVFDYAPDGERLARFIVLDDSSGSFSSTDQNPSEDQNLCLQSAIKDADLVARIPSIVVMNRPTQDPLAAVPETTAIPDAVQFTTTVTGTGVSAVFASHYRENAVYFLPADGVPGAVASYVSGGGGAPLGGSREPTSGFYHAWLLARIDTDTPANLTGQRPVGVRVYPVLESLSMHAHDGVSVEGGQTLRFSGLGRAPDGGGPGDPSQSAGTYIPLPQPGRCAPVCVTTGRLAPEYRFESSNPRVGLFVRAHPGEPTLPFITATGGLLPDETSGLFCAVGSGETDVALISGFHRVVKRVVVEGGFGPCVRQRVKNRTITREPPEPPPPQPERPAVAEPGRPFFRTAPDSTFGTVLPPPPFTVAAPAPPGAPGVGRKEEHEYSPEQEGHSQGGKRYSFRPAREPRRSGLEAAPWLTIAAVVGAAYASARAAARAQAGTRPRPARLRVGDDDR